MGPDPNLVADIKHIGFIGAGVMGHGMASCLLGAGHTVHVIAHRNRRPIDDLVARGAHEARNFAQLAARSETIILCVTSSGVVEQVIDMLQAELRPGMMIIDMGTSSPDSSRRICARLGELGVSYAEAPVTGGVKQAASGELGALVGAERAAFEAARPLLDAMCKTVHHFGPPGAGNTAKLLNNYMVSGIAALVVEAFGKAREAEVDWQKLYDAVICGSADSGVLRRIIGAAIHGDYKGYVFSVDGALKDMRYFGELSDSTGGLSELGRAVTNVYERAVSEGRGDRLLSELLAPEPDDHKPDDRDPRSPEVPV